MIYYVKYITSEDIDEDSHCPANSLAFCSTLARLSAENQINSLLVQTTILQ